MKIEVLISTMNQKDMQLINKMNINTDAIIINQSNFFNFEEVEMDDKVIKMFSFNERGIGKSRNNALMRSTGDICLLADDDMIYVDNYENIVLEAFRENPKADIIVFNVPSKNIERPTVKITKNTKLNFMNLGRFGAVNIAFKRNSILKANASFSLLFGGGAEYSAGEDSLFLFDCLKKGLLIYSSTKKIADVNQDTSTWFEGFNKKYFFDKGVFFASLSKWFSYFLTLQFALRKYSFYKNEISFKDACKYMLNGIKHFNSN